MLHTSCIVRATLLSRYLSEAIELSPERWPGNMANSCSLIAHKWNSQEYSSSCSLCGEQFWGGLFGRPATRKSSGRLLILLSASITPAARTSLPTHPVREGSLSATPSRKIVPTTML